MQPEGVVVRSTKGAEYTVLRPTLEDYVIEMPRGAQVIYPKDLAPICMLADIGPGMRVFETGIGSGALSMTMLRWGATIVGYEIREDFANRARANVRSFLGAHVLDRYDVHIADSYEGIDDGPFDRVVLDLPEPWQVIPHAEPVLHAGGCSSRTRRRSSRPPRRARSSRVAGSTPARSRSSTAAGTSTGRRCAPTTGWWPTRRSSPSPAFSARALASSNSDARVEPSDAV